MDIEQIKIRKAILESAIKHLVDSFETETQCHVRSIDLDRVDVESFTTGFKPLLSGVSIDVVLP